MLDRLGRCWRILATGACFLVFGMGGAVFGLIVFPLLCLFVPAGERRRRVARAVIHGTFGWFVALMRAAGVITVEVRGLDKLRSGGQLILANHPTLIDVVLLMSLIERADCIVKGALGRNPFTRGPVLAAGFVFNDSAEGLVEDCVASIQAGNNLIIFPEGTRSSRTEPMRLQRGAARVALQAGVDITPVRIGCMPLTLAKGEKWYEVPVRRPHFRVVFCEPIPVGAFQHASPSQAVAARRLTQHLTQYFLKEHELGSA